MSTKTDFTPQEWDLLKRAPVLVGLAVLAAADSGSDGTADEQAAIFHAIEHTNDPTPLIQELAAAVRGEAHDLSQVTGQNNYHAAALQACGDARDILAARGSAEESEHYKTWLLAVGGRVAAEAREGAASSARVSDAEIARLNEIAAVLYAQSQPEREVFGRAAFAAATAHEVF